LFSILTDVETGIARGVLGAIPPRAEKNFGGIIYRGKLYVLPTGRARVNFLRTFLSGRGGDFEDWNG